MFNFSDAYTYIQIKAFIIVDLVWILILHGQNLCSNLIMRSGSDSHKVHE